MNKLLLTVAAVAVSATTAFADGVKQTELDAVGATLKDAGYNVTNQNSNVTVLTQDHTRKQIVMNVGVGVAPNANTQVNQSELCGCGESGYQSTNQNTFADVVSGSLAVQNGVKNP